MKKNKLQDGIRVSGHKTPGLPVKFEDKGCSKCSRCKEPSQFERGRTNRILLMLEFVSLRGKASNWYTVTKQMGRLMQIVQGHGHDNEPPGDVSLPNLVR